MSDHFLGHPDSVSCVTPVNDNIVQTGSSDGLVRAVNILSNLSLDAVGEHQFEVEEMALSHDCQLLLSCSHDQCVKFWSVANIHEERVEVHKKSKHSAKSKRLGTTRKNNFLAGLAEEEEEHNDNDDDDNDEDSSDEDSE